MPVKTLKGNLYNLEPGRPVKVGPILFEKIEVESITAKTDAPVSVPGKPKAAKKAEPVEEDPNQVDFTKMDLRVGIITRVWHHETGERLFCEEIDVGGEGAKLSVASGLREFYTKETMLHRKVIVVCNLKEIKLQGYLSCGMVLAAKTGTGQMVLLDPPSGSAAGDKVYIDGLKEGDVGGGLPATANKVKKNKIWEAVADKLSTNDKGEACWDGKLLLVAGESVVAITAPSSKIQ